MIFPAQFTPMPFCTIESTFVVVVVCFKSKFDDGINKSSDIGKTTEICQLKWTNLNYFFRECEKSKLMDYDHHFNDSTRCHHRQAFVCAVHEIPQPKNFHFYPSKCAKIRERSGNVFWQHNKNLWDRARSRVFAWHVIEFHRWKMRYFASFRRNIIIRRGRWHNSVDWNWSVVEKWEDFSSSSEVDYPHKLYFALSRAAADFPPKELGQSIEKFIIPLTLSVLLLLMVAKKKRVWNSWQPPTTLTHLSPFVII